MNGLKGKMVRSTGKSIFHEVRKRNKGIREIIMSDRVVSMPEFLKEFELKTDASD